MGFTVKKSNFFPLTCVPSVHLSDKIARAVKQLKKINLAPVYSYGYHMRKDDNILVCPTPITFTGPSNHNSVTCSLGCILGYDLEKLKLEIS